MKKKNKGKYIVFIIVILLIIIGIIYYNKSNNAETEETTNVSETEVIKTDIINTLSNSSYVETSLEENKELHATYYFEEIYFSENQQISEGEKILKYTNGKYMYAPYDCVITSMSLPESEEVCTNRHYITIQSTSTLQMSLKIEEDEIDKVYLGQEAIIEVDVLEDDLTGYVTNISNTANYSSSGSTFAVTVEFQNDGNVLLGMSAKCSVVLEKAEDVIAVAKEAVQETNNSKYVTVKTENGTEDVQIETGIENDAYIEVKNGLEVGDIVIIEEEESSNSQNRNGRTQGMDRDSSGMQGGGMDKSSGSSGERPSFSGGEMPSGGQR